MMRLNVKRKEEHVESGLMYRACYRDCTRGTYLM